MRIRSRQPNKPSLPVSGSASCPPDGASPPEEAGAASARELDISKLQQLSVRQREVLRLIAEGENTKEIAVVMGITVRTVETHRLRLMRRLDINNIAMLVRFAIRTGVVTIDG